MVLERLIGVKEAVKNPLWMFVIGGVVAITCLLVAALIFNENVGSFTTFLVTMAITPFMVRLARWEEGEQENVSDQVATDELSFVQRYRGIVMIYAAFFCGVILSYSVLYVIIPEAATKILFGNQMDKINEIRVGGMATQPGVFAQILANNIGVLFLSFLFSFLFGAGAIFILTWNASVLATAIGSLARSIGGLAALPLAIVPYFPHGSLEILAYFIGAIAGGIVSAAMTRRKSKRFWFVVKDGTKLMGVSVVILVVAAFVEVLAMSA